MVPIFCGKKGWYFSGISPLIILHLFGLVNKQQCTLYGYFFQGFPPFNKAFVWVGVLHHDPFSQLPSSEPPGPYSSLWGIAQQKICCVTVHKERLHWRENQKRQKARDDILRKKGPPYKTSSKSSENKIGINNSKGKWIIFQPLIFRGFCC